MRSGLSSRIDEPDVRAVLAIEIIDLDREAVIEYAHPIVLTRWAVAEMLAYPDKNSAIPAGQPMPHWSLDGLRTDSGAGGDTVVRCVGPCW
jgi:hypothetical protein